MGAVSVRIAEGRASGTVADDRLFGVVVRRLQTDTPQVVWLALMLCVAALRDKQVATEHVP